MAFCTGCGARLDDNAKFCTGCGASVTAGPAAGGQPRAAAAPAPAQVVSAPPPAKGGSGALKIVLIVLGIFVVLGIVAMGLVGYGAYRVKKAITNEAGGSTSVTLPGVSIRGGENASAESVVSDLGVEMYPGAVAKGNSAGSVTIGGLKMGGAEFVTDDPVAQVVEFYRGKYPKSTISAADESHQSIVIANEKGFITIEVEGQEGKTHIRLSRMGGGSSQ